MTPSAFRASAPVFAALGDATRLALVQRLCSRGPASITALTEGSEVSRQAISKHLDVLAGAGLVQRRQRGRESIWELRRRRLDEARRALDAIEQQWDAALERLKTLVEE